MGIWTPQSSPIGDDGVPAQTLVLAGSRILAGSIASPCLMVSDDAGVTWTSKASPFDSLAGGVFGLAYSEDLDRVVAVGGETAIQLSYSDDQGETWTLVTVDATASGSLTAVARDDDQGVFVAVGTGPEVAATSADGITWSVSTTPWDGTGSAYGVCYAAGSINKWVVVGVNYFGDGTTAMTATDPTSTWTVVASGPFDGAVGWAGYGQGQTVAFDGTSLIAGSFSGTTGISTSTDANTWNARTGGLDDAVVYGVAAIPERSLALGENGIYESIDSGTTWTVDATNPFTSTGTASAQGGYAAVFLDATSAVAGGIDEFGTIAIATGSFTAIAFAPVRILVAFTDDTLTEEPDFTDLAAP